MEVQVNGSLVPDQQHVAAIESIQQHVEQDAIETHHHHPQHHTVIEYDATAVEMHQHPTTVETHADIETHHSEIETHHGEIETHHSEIETHHSEIETHHSEIETHHEEDMEAEDNKIELEAQRAEIESAPAAIQQHMEQAHMQSVAYSNVELQDPENRDTWSEALLLGLNEMRKTNTLCDVILNSADNKLYCVHSAVLGAGSKFFRQVLAQSKTSGGGIVVRLEKSGDLVHKMVDFLYTGRTEASMEELGELRQMAEGYGLEKLALLCTERLYGIKVTIVHAQGEEPEYQTLVESMGNDGGAPPDNYVMTSDTPEGDTLTGEAPDIQNVESQIQIKTSNRGRRMGMTQRRPPGLGKKTWRDYRYQCNFCRKDFTSLSRLKGHEATHMGEKKHECNICGAKFIQVEYLREHISVHTDQRPFKCEECGSFFRLLRHLKKHQKVHSSDRPFVCPQCPKTFKRSDRLRQHMRIHTGERPFGCEICDKRFKVMEALVRHRKTIHFEDCPFRCGFCSAGFKKVKNLEEHMYRCEDAILKRRNACDECGAIFKTKMTLLRHKRRHVFDKQNENKENTKKLKKKKKIMTEGVVVKQEKLDDEEAAAVGAPIEEGTEIHEDVGEDDGEVHQVVLREDEHHALNMLIQEAGGHPQQMIVQETGEVHESDGPIQVLHVEFVPDGTTIGQEHVAEEGVAEETVATEGQTVEHIVAAEHMEDVTGHMIIDPSQLEHVVHYQQQS